MFRECRICGYDVEDDSMFNDVCDGCAIDERDDEISDLKNQLIEKEKCRADWMKQCEYYRERYNALRNGLHELDQKLKGWNNETKTI